MGPVPQAGHRDGHHQVREVGRPAGRRARGWAGGEPDSAGQRRARRPRLPALGSGPRATRRRWSRLFSFGTERIFFFFFKKKRSIEVFQMKTKTCSCRIVPQRSESQSRGGPAARPCRVSAVSAATPQPRDPSLLLRRRIWLGAPRRCGVSRSLLRPRSPE